MVPYLIKDGIVANNDTVYGNFNERVKKAAQDAEFQFWCVISDNFPEITKGDVDPWTSMKFGQELEERVKRWYNDNKD